MTKRAKLIKQSEAYIIKQMLPLFDDGTNTKPQGSMSSRFLPDDNEELNKAVNYNPNEYTRIMKRARKNIKELLKARIGEQVHSMKIITKHTLDYCHLCEADMVRCGTCGNNCCSGGYGTINGVQCIDCSDAYDIQYAYFVDCVSVKFANTMNRWWERLLQRMNCFFRGHRFQVMMCMHCGMRKP
jgi:hypothetical protein